MLLLASGSRWEESKFMVSYVFIEKLNIDLHSVKIGCVFACYWKYTLHLFDQSPSTKEASMQCE